MTTPEFLIENIVEKCNQLPAGKCYELGNFGQKRDLSLRIYKDPYFQLNCELWNSVAIHVYCKGEAILHRQDVDIEDLYPELEQIYFDKKRRTLFC